MTFMDIVSALRARAGALFNEGGPWGGRGKGGGGDSGGGGPRNPWNQPPGGGKPRGPRGASALDQLLEQLRGLFGGGGPLPGGGNGASIIRFGLIALVVIWFLFTSFHRIEPQQEGVVTRFGKYAGKLEPGIGMTLPAPIDRVEKVNIRGIKSIDIPDGAGQNLILTGDQNVIDLAYQVRWSVRQPENFLFELAQPEATIREVAESAMREVMSTVTLNDAFGPRRSQIETRVAQRMQVLLNDYKAGITIRGVAIKQADPPAQVNDAFKLVTVKQQEKQANINNANTYAQQVIARAEGEAASFDKVYAQYKLAPGVTRKRMYYETMEAVLSNTDKTIVEPGSIAPYLPLGNGRPRVTVEEAGR
ncbi:protease modulator HflK [Aquisediminimonas profunda]|uniref:protease modulator HflK n=1 Tax=Aquisediminimonas profunda TaxID=1550733 RepID=UPI001C63021C|nr:protease modulator HflK [Aquisediminimonas profunda]